MLAVDLSQIAGSSMEASKSLRVRSALNPGLWLVGVSVPCLLLFAYLMRENVIVMYLLIIVAICVITIVGGSYLYFVLFKPEKLQSEDYQIRHMAMQIYQQHAGSLATTEIGMANIANSKQGMIEQ